MVDCEYYYYYYYCFWANNNANLINYLFPCQFILQICNLSDPAGLISEAARRPCNVDLNLAVSLLRFFLASSSSSR